MTDTTTTRRNPAITPGVADLCCDRTQEYFESIKQPLDDLRFLLGNLPEPQREEVGDLLNDFHRHAGRLSIQVKHQIRLAQRASAEAADNIAEATSNMEVA